MGRNPPPHTFLLRQEQPCRQVSVKPHSSGQQPSGWTHRASPHRKPNCTSTQRSTHCKTMDVAQQSHLPNLPCSKQAHSHREDFSSTINHDKGCLQEALPCQPQPRTGLLHTSPCLPHSRDRSCSHEDTSSELSSQLEHPEGTLLSSQH